MSKSTHESKAFKMPPWPASHHNKCFIFVFVVSEFLCHKLLPQIIAIKIHIQEQASPSASFLYHKELP